jgi:hypothetical protein
VLVKIILIAVFLQLSLDPAGQPSIAVVAATSSEFDSSEACQNAGNGLARLGEVTGFKVNSICAPKDLAKLEVEKPKPKPPAARPAPSADWSS